MRLGFVVLLERFFACTNILMTTKLVPIIKHCLTMGGIRLKLDTKTTYKKVIHILYTSFEHFYSKNDRRYQNTHI